MLRKGQRYQSRADNVVYRPEMGSEFFFVQWPIFIVFLKKGHKSLIKY